jgi:hypothetical protein
VDRIVGYWQQAGLENVQVRRMSLGGGIVMSATRGAGTGGGEPRPRAAAGLQGDAGDT